MKVRVDPRLCQGHTLCAMTAPELFGLREEDGHSYVPADEVPTELADKARTAVRSCPEQAIEITP